MQDPSIIETTCKICGKAIMGRKYDRDTFYEVEDTNKYCHMIGFACRNCGACYCDTGHGKMLGFSWWSGYEKSLCPECAEPLSSRLIITDTSLKVPDEEFDPSAMEVSPETEACIKCGRANVLLSPPHVLPIDAPKPARPNSQHNRPYSYEH